MAEKLKRVLFVNPPDVDESIFDYDVAKKEEEIIIHLME